jgi:hypothetical protein
MLMFGNAPAALRKITAFNLVSLLMSVVMLQACSGQMASDSPAQAPEPVRTPTFSQSRSMPPNDMYLFMEIWIVFDGTGTLPMKFVDFPGYEYNPATGTLRSYGRGKQISLNSEDWGFIGLGEKRAAATGGGTASQLSTIDQIPFTVSAPIFAGKLGEYAEEINYIPITLLAVSMDGEVVIDIDGHEVVLPKGEKWEQMQDMAVNTERFNGHLRVTSSVINYGWNPRSLIDSK